MAMVVMNMGAPADSYQPPSPSPRQFHDESLTSPLNPNPPHSVISITDTDTSGPTTFQPFGIDQSDQFQGNSPPAGGNNMVDWVIDWIRRRNQRRASYPPPLKQCFDHFEFWKVCPTFSALFGSVATFANLKLISREFMRVALALLTTGILCVTVAHILQDMLPEVAVAAMLTGIGLVIALFHTLAFMLFDLPDKLFHLVASFFILAYSILFVLTLYQLFKEDVREKECTEEA